MRSIRVLQFVACFLVLAALAFAQVGNSTITGTVTDQAGAVVPGVTVEAKNQATGVVFRGVTSSAGDYTIVDLPVGTYAVSVAFKGFKTFNHSNLDVSAAQILRENIALQVGNQTESVTVTDQATLLKTESSDIASNITLKDLDDLPMLGIGTANSGSTGVRNPYNVLQLLPGVTGFIVGQGYGFTVNGQGTETMVIEGQDATSRVFGTFVYDQMAQPSADSIQEMAVQTSNYAAEYGQASSAVLNMTMKSGTNQWHGSGYEYWVNEDLNAGAPFSVSGGVGGGNGSKLDPRARRNDFGGTLGGPIYIPKVYNGHDKTFFFWNYEEFLETQGYAPVATVPVAAYLGGDFSAISPNGTCSLCGTAGVSTNPLGCLPGAPVTSCSGQVLDPQGRQEFANTVYNPNTRVLSNGIGYATPFLGNKVPSTMFDQVALKMQALFPAAQNSNLNNNYTHLTPGNRYSAIPSLKLDHNLSAKDKLSFYYSEINTESQISEPFGSVDGLPLEIGEYRGTFIPSYTYRLNYDRTLKPNLLLHLGVGYLFTSFADHAPFLNFDPSQFGLTGFLIHRQFPSVAGLCTIPLFATSCSATGGMQGFGTSGQIQTQNYEEKPSYSANATYIRGKHTIKIGADMYFEGALSGTFAGVTLTTSGAPTSQPFSTGFANTFGQGVGFGYASFLLGDYTQTSQTPQLNYREGYGNYSVYIQDSWKVTRKLTLDYGLRWDLYGAEHEQYGRVADFAQNTPNANAGGRLGATQYASTCGCNYYQGAYPYAIGPRFGVAYQINPKTVFRGGWGVVYSIISNGQGTIVSSAGVYPVTGINGFVNTQTAGFIQQPVWPVTNPNIYPLTGTVPGPGGFFAPANTPQINDANINRPPRINQFSAGFQREVTRNFVVEASYVGNRGAWLGGGLGFFSQISPKQYASLGLYPYPGTAPPGMTSAQYSASYRPTGVNCPAGGNDCDRALLGLTLTNPAVMAKLAANGVGNGGLLVPYGGSNPFPESSVTLGNAIVPYPQMGNFGVTGSPTGDNKYDSLQIKMTKRLSHGLAAGGTFTWAQGFTEGTRQDFWNPQSTVNILNGGIPPRVLQFNFTYTVPKAEFLDKVKFANAIVKDWQIGGYATYESAPFLTNPSSPTANFLGSQEQYVAGQPLYNVANINDIHNVNPLTQVILNPNAWTACPANTTCAANQQLKDFRGFRHPQENANFGRNFRIKERMNLYIRAEFVNIFNRTGLPQPSTGSPQSPVQHTGTALTGGYGVSNVYQPAGSDAIFAPGANGVLSPRTGTLIARFTF